MKITKVLGIIAGLTFAGYCAGEWDIERKEKEKNRELIAEEVMSRIIKRDRLREVEERES